MLGTGSSVCLIRSPRSPIVTGQKRSEPRAVGIRGPAVSMTVDLERSQRRLLSGAFSSQRCYLSARVDIVSRSRELDDWVVNQDRRNFRCGSLSLRVLRRSWRRPVSALAAFSVLLLLFMPMAPVRAAPPQHHHGLHHGHHHGPVKAPPCADHDQGTCPFCVAHPGFSLPPPLHPAQHLPSLKSEGVVERVARIEAPFQPLRSRHRSRAPPQPIAL